MFKTIKKIFKRNSPNTNQKNTTSSGKRPISSRSQNSTKKWNGARKKNWQENSAENKPYSKSYAKPNSKAGKKFRPHSKTKTQGRAYEKPAFQDNSEGSEQEYSLNPKDSRYSYSSPPYKKNSQHKRKRRPSNQQEPYTKQNDARQGEEKHQEKPRYPESARQGEEKHQEKPRYPESARQGRGRHQEKPRYPESARQGRGKHRYEGKSKPSKSYDPQENHEEEQEQVEPVAAYVSGIEEDDSLFKTEKSFQQLGITHEDLLARLEENKFRKPTVVQEKIIDFVLNGQNIVCSSPTGTGKTLAFVIPILQRMFAGDVYQVLVLSPTREIAMQTLGVFNQFLPYKDINSGLIVGGLDMGQQAKVLSEYPRLLIATPGRLLYAIREGKVWLDYTRIVVLDEMDTMLDMGFEDQIIEIYKNLPDVKAQTQDTPSQEDANTKKTLQMLTFTATLVPEIGKSLKPYMSDYKEVIMGELMGVNKNIEHLGLETNNKDKFQMLIKILTLLQGQKALVFFNTINETVKMASELRRKGIKGIMALHSRKSQEQRNEAIENFRSGKKNMLLATDLAARGLDIPKVKIVVNFGLPSNSENYVHRIGRTGRVNLKGKALSLFTDREKLKLRNIEKLLKKKVRLLDKNQLENFLLDT